MNALDLNKKKLSFLVFGFVLLSLIYRALTGALLSQLATPVLISPGADNLFWLYSLAGIPPLLSSGPIIPLVFDIIFFVLALWCLTGTRNWLIPSLLLFWALTYYVVYHNYVGHHGHSFLGILFMVFPFTMKSESSFKISWQAVRYYLCYIFASAALWKIFRGSAFSSEHLEAILLSQHVDLLVYKPEALIAGNVSILLDNSWMTRIIFPIVVMLQLSFIVGFFTRKYDKVLLAFMVFFVISNYFTTRINFAELLIFGIVLLPIRDKLE